MVEVLLDQVLLLEKPFIYLVQVRKSCNMIDAYSVVCFSRDFCRQCSTVR